MSNSSELHSYIEQLRRRLRLGTWLRGAAIFFGTALAVTVLLVLLLNHFAFPLRGVWIARVTILAALGAVASLGIALPIIRLTRLRAVAHAEAANPELEQRLRTFEERAAKGDDPFLELLAANVRDGMALACTATSERTAAKARTLGIALHDLDSIAPLDLTIDGADEADRALNLIKGGGAALLREKIVAASSKSMIVIIDESKLVAPLGRFPLPVEIVPFGHVTTAARIAHAAANLGYRDLAIRQRLKDGVSVVTDSGNLVYDCAFGAIADARALAAALSAIPGVIEHGLFIGLASMLVIARPGGIEIVGKLS